MGEIRVDLFLANSSRSEELLLRYVEAGTMQDASLHFWENTPLLICQVDKAGSTVNITRLVKNQIDSAVFREVLNHFPDLFFASSRFQVNFDEDRHIFGSRHVPTQFVRMDNITPPSACPEEKYVLKVRVPLRGLEGSKAGACMSCNMSDLFKAETACLV